MMTESNADPAFVSLTGSLYMMERGADLKPWSIRQCREAELQTILHVME